jgi:hypothetical protein
MRKLLTGVLSLTLVVAMFTGCGKKEETTTNEVTPTTATEATETPAAEATATPEATEAPATTEAAAAKTGLAIITSVGKSTPAAEEDGLAQVDSTVVAVLVGQDGKILACDIDASQAKMNFSKEGKLITDIATVFKPKQELGTEYGLGAASAIGKEWNEQADAFAAYVVGKTVDEVKGIAVAEGIATDADLTSSVTIHITDFVAGVEKAVANAQELGATSTDKLGLGVSTDMSKSKDATAEEAGVAQAYSFYSAVTTNAEGKITSCAIDASQGTINFDTTGAISTDITVAQQSKQELKEAYGMKAASGIAKEWYEQANAFAAYATGKTIDEVKGIAVSAEGLATDADLVSSVTVHVAPFIGIVEKAATNSAK